MDREALARTVRRRQALEALEFERARAAALQEQLETIVTELEGPGVDEPIFAAMEPGEIEVVRPVLQPVEPELDDFDEFEDDEEEGVEPEPELDLRESEVGRLQEEIAGSRRRQRAFERYLELLGRE